MNANVKTFTYDRKAVKAGILHFGVGNFHRAHLEYLTNLLLENNPDQRQWGICGAMILPQDERMYNALKNQNGEYTLTVCGRDGKDETWLIGSLVELYWGMNNQEAILNKIADPVAWLEAGTIDYISPQLYWKTDHSTNPFGPMTQWWSYVAKHFNRHHYASHSLTFLQSSNTTSDWVEVGKQLQFSRRYTKNKAPGSIYYSACDIDGKKVEGIGEWLKKNKYQHPALTPAIDWKDVFPHQRVNHLVFDGTMLSWDEEPNVRYTVYAIPDEVSNESAQSSTLGGILADYLLGTIYTNSFTVPDEYVSDYHFAVCILDRCGNEYEPRFTNETEIEHTPKPLLIWPDDGAVFRPSIDFVWQGADAADSYMVEVSRNKRFTDLVLTATSGWFAESDCMVLSTSDETFEEGTYYWRVTAAAAGQEESVSYPRSFTISYSADQEGTGMSELAMSSPEIMVTLSGHEIRLNQIVDNICIYNMQGMLIVHQRNTDSVDMSGERDGIYIIKVMAGGRSVVKKVKK